MSTDAPLNAPRRKPEGLAMVGTRRNRRELRNFGTCKPNEPCPCASGKKFKKCCQYRHCASQAEVAARALEPGTKVEVPPGQKLTPAAVAAALTLAQIKRSLP